MTIYKYIRPRSYYEDLYDRLTVEYARDHIGHYDKFHADLIKKLPKDDTIDRPGNALILNTFYMQVIGAELLRRYENREQRILEWIARDEAKDEQIASARLKEEPYCHHCNKHGLRIIDKSLMHRSKNAKYDDPEEVLFMLKCPHCDKNSAFWEDGTAWKVIPTVCPKCNSEVTHTSTKTKNYITITYSCPSCKHSFKEKLDISTKKEKPDPDFAKDRIHYCLEDKKFRDHLFAIRKGFEDMAQLGREIKEKEDNKHIYDAMKEMRKPKVAELITILSPIIEKEGFIEFTLGKPEAGRELTVEISCLDNKPERGDYDSRKILKKTIDTALEDTNWRLMSDGITYRLGYLSSKLRAYDNDDDLKKLVMKSKKLKPKQKANDTSDNERTFTTPDGKKIIL